MPEIKFYHKVYRGKDEQDTRKYTITEEEVDKLVNLMNSNSESDIKIAIHILSKSNCNRFYGEIIYKCIQSKWTQVTSKDGVNKRITRLIK